MSKKITPEDVAKEIDEFQLKHYGYLLRDYPEPFDDEYTSETTSEEEPLPPETRISATPIGTGFVNILNLDEIPRPPSPPLQEPRPYYSSDSDSDDVIVMKRPQRPSKALGVNRPPSRIAEDIIYRRPVYPIPQISIAPMLNKEPFQEGENKVKMEQMEQQIHNLQTENQRLKNLLLVSMK